MPRPPTPFAQPLPDEDPEEATAADIAVANIAVAVAETAIAEADVAEAVVAGTAVAEAIVAAAEAALPDVPDMVGIANDVEVEEDMAAAGRIDVGIVIPEATSQVGRIDYDCPVCLDGWIHKSPWVLRCRHVLCGECARRIMRTTKICPICNARIVSRFTGPLYLV